MYCIRCTGKFSPIMPYQVSTCGHTLVWDITTVSVYHHYTYVNLYINLNEDDTLVLIVIPSFTHTYWKRLFMSFPTKASINLVKVFCGCTVSYRTCSRRFKKFEIGDFALTDKPCLGRLSFIDDDIVKAMLEQDPFFTTSQIAERFNSGQQTILDHTWGIRENFE